MKKNPDKNKNLNIAYFVLSMEIGGLERLVEQLFKQLVRDEQCGHLFCLDILGVIGEKLYSDDYSIQNFKRKVGFVDFKLLRALVKQIKKRKIKIIHSHNQEALFYAVLVKTQIPSINIIHTQHGVEPPVTWKKRIKQRILGLFIKKYIGVSADVTSIASTQYGIQEKKLDVILNGVNTELFSRRGNAASLRMNNGLKPTDFIIICVARLALIKNHLLIIDIADELRTKGKKFKILFIGDGLERASIEKQISSKKLDDYFVMVGEKNNIDEYLNMADIFLLTSLSEGINVALLEAMAMEVVPVVSNVGGNKEVIINEINGILIEDFDPKKYSNAIIELANKNDKLTSLSHAARKTVEDKFSLDRMYIEYRMLYAECLLAKY